jgi:hypothetical protein
MKYKILTILFLVSPAFCWTYWDNQSGDKLWTNPVNWDTNSVPVAGDSPRIDKTALTSQL